MVSPASNRTLVRFNGKVNIIGPHTGRTWQNVTLESRDTLKFHVSKELCLKTKQAELGAMMTKQHFK